MKFIFRQIAIILGAITIFLVGKHILSEKLVVESEPVAHMSFDERIASIPFETITFGMG